MVWSLVVVHLQQRSVDLVQVELSEPGGDHGALGAVCGSQYLQLGGQEQLQQHQDISRSSQS
jgi:hypothetical protein